MIYLLVNKKGGVGKSTIAASLAVYLHDLGRKVAVLDADEQLHTLRALVEAEPQIAVGAQFDPDQIPKTIKGLAATHDDVVADAPARLGDETRSLMLLADVAIFPMEPTIKCLRSTKESVKVLEYARDLVGRPKHAWLVLNKAKKRTRIFREIETLAPQLGLQVATSVVRDLQAFPEADQQGTVVTRMSSDSIGVRNAHADITALFSEIVQLQTRKVANE
ncbi:MAG: ParA family protein [Pirellulaceae bacterium]